MDCSLDTWAQLAIEAAKAAALELRAHYREDARVESDAGRDLKTLADRAAEAAVLSRLRTTNVPILSEECGDSFLFRADQLHWIVDPLDGTMNFARKIPLACVSVALWRGMQPLMGVVYDLDRDELFVGKVEQRDASVNGRPIGVASTATLAHAVLATGFPVGRSFAQRDLAAFGERICRFKMTRTTLATIVRDEHAHAALAWASLRWILQAYPETLDRAKPPEVCTSAEVLACQATEARRHCRHDPRDRSDRCSTGRDRCLAAAFGRSFRHPTDARDH